MYAMAVSCPVAIRCHACSPEKRLIQDGDGDAHRPEGMPSAFMRSSVICNLLTKLLVFGPFHVRHWGGGRSDWQFSPANPRTLIVFAEMKKKKKKKEKRRECTQCKSALGSWLLTELVLTPTPT